MTKQVNVIVDVVEHLLNKEGPAWIDCGVRSHGQIFSGESDEDCELQDLIQIGLPGKDITMEDIRVALKKTDEVPKVEKRCYLFGGYHYYKPLKTLYFRWK